MFNFDEKKYYGNYEHEKGKKSYCTNNYGGR